ncbi:hypothetical protein A3I53_01235 [Candidatus Curtissbacteria bacterium RIFCSPLOWO2_02_FULL_40_13b]|uniref:Glycosyltransferase RgtA/B/C/D-like domain-containing protein n=3 Tax=Candidatus Curtissiibacteriota TaxID=1752717 RepID=A0A1F5HYA9_9BACT|nr:MAG: hypothetical protein A2693_04635 [Candidatus Curtissbacteria bacterium RIFCSPHIGHO2_01_FULL_40_12]OGE05565.1 MAG: hypothetical protein A3F45_00640 [Candidatus Curtissbacteria bacterium RIFCSPHIGHO2_12_FULL_41_17]OGE09086.1 MAG: hypothetical protein A3I53_01235 [Candidatus Curtissbacteria bacterium RIFCSPLOWO2_02_FULL_40_13b]
MKNKLEFFFWPLIGSVYFLTRTINLKIIPIFTDEAIYTYWAQVALHDPANRFISLEDGKQPLFIWFAAIFQKFIGDPLIATRAVSILAGFGSLIGIYFLSKELFSEKVAKLSAILYLILPLTLLYDRMALFDSLLTMFGIWGIFFTIKLARKARLDTAILAGFSIGFAMITKSSGVFFLYFLPLSLLFFDFSTKNRHMRFLKWLGLSAITAVLTQVIYNSLRLSPLFYIIDRKNSEFIRPFSEVLANPFIFFKSNVITFSNWLVSYISWPLFLLFVISVLWGIYKMNKRIIYLSFLFLIPFLAESVFNKVIYPRFLLFYFPFLIIIISHGLINFSNRIPRLKKVLAVIFISFLILPLLSSYFLLTNPTRARIADSDSGQYLNDWPAGYGVSQVVDVIREESKDKKVYVATEGTFGLLPYALQVYFFGNQNVQIEGFWPVDANKLPQQVLDQAQITKTYFVFNENQKEILNQKLKFVAKFQKGKGNSYMRLYQVVP